jgi:hypothetical protein
MSRLTGRRLATVVLVAVVAIAVAGWLAARQIRSPAQIAADTRAPKAVADHRPSRAPHAGGRGHRARHGALRRAADGRPRHFGVKQASQHRSSRTLPPDSSVTASGW